MKQWNTEIPPLTDDELEEAHELASDILSDERAALEACEELVYRRKLTA